MFVYAIVRTASNLRAFKFKFEDYYSRVQDYMRRVPVPYSHLRVTKKARLSLLFCDLFHSGELKNKVIHDFNIIKNASGQINATIVIINRYLYRSVRGIVYLILRM